MTFSWPSDGDVSRGRRAPVLRAPPFRPLRPIVSRPIDGAISMLAGAGARRRIERIGEALRSQRVGGDFWAAGAGLAASVRTVLRAADRAVLSAELPALLAASDAASVHVWMPNAAWSRAAAMRLGKAGLGVTLGSADPWSILDHAETVSVEVDDELGLLAAVAGVAVRRQGVNGAVPGDLAAPLDRVHARLIDSAAYFDPFDGTPSSCEAIIEVLADWRRQILANRTVVACVGVAGWKRGEVRQLLFRGDREVSFHATAGAAVGAAAAQGGAVAVWPSRAPRGLKARARKAGVPLVRIEDGFVRSVGLGCNLWPPASLSVDAQGLHCDPSAPSDLETILADTEFSSELLARAERLIRMLVDLGVTKYNLAGETAPRFDPSRRTVLVAGQVEDDLSVTLGGGPGAGNLDLLREARALEPDAWLVYKPHPDVVSGHRRGAVPDRTALRHADAVLPQTAMSSLLAQVDGVHTLTSLTGFEALLRGREVTVHGQPFYSGWGLTRDLRPLPRRRRCLTLAELVAGALILYPRYVDPKSGVLCPPEVLVARLAQPGRRRGALLPWLMSLQGRARGLVGQAGLAH